MQFVTTKQHRYRGKMRKIGDTYEIAGKSDARLVQALGWSIPAPVVAPVVVAPVVAKVAKVAAPVVVAPVESPAPVVAEPVAEPAPEVTAEAAPEPGPVIAAQPDTDKPKRVYTRRNLSAE